MVVEILVAERDPKDALRQEVADGVLDPRRIAVVVEAMRELLDDLGALLGLLQQQHAAVRGDVAAVEIGSDDPPSWTLEEQFPSRTLCRHLTVWFLSKRRCRNPLYAAIRRSDDSSW